MKAFFASLLALFLWLPLTAHAEISAEDSKAIDQKFASFIALVNDGKIEAAYDALFLPAIVEKPSILNQLIAATKSIVEFQDHKPLQYALARESEFSSVMVHRVYVVYTDKVPGMIRVNFFKTSKGWFAQSIYLNDITVDNVD